MTPLEAYQEQIRKGLSFEDKDQVQALQHLQKLWQHLLLENKKRSSLIACLRKPKALRGLYLWGGVGIGKTFVMDCFFHSLPFANKLRMHFHQFMAMVHQELKKQQGNKDPLQIIAQQLSQKAQVLCFDEFYVTDIADAMLLGRLLEALFSQGICLVATSNVAPDELYKNGLQRQHFMPVIALLKKQVEVLHLPGRVDYRLRHLKHAGVFYIPNDEAANDNMEKSFSLLANKQPVSFEALKLFERKIPIKKEAGDLIWLDFKVICGPPRSQEDYLALVKRYKTIFISDLPIISSDSKDQICLLIRLVDVMYDAGARLVLSAESTMDNIYSSGRMIFEYSRTFSRLLEMQSEEYFLK